MFEWNKMSGIRNSAQVNIKDEKYRRNYDRIFNKTNDKTKYKTLKPKKSGKRDN